MKAAIGSITLLAAAILTPLKQSYASPAWIPQPPGAAASQANQKTCFDSEGFHSYDEWAAANREWTAKRPPLPNPVLAYEAMKLVNQERPFALQRFHFDKAMHCYIGCRLAQETNFRTAKFGAWEKERRDLNDCDANSHFELADYEVTVLGAQIGLTVKTATECVTACDREAF